MKKALLYALTLSATFAACTPQEKYKDKNRTPHERAKDLVSRLTLEEKVGLMTDSSRPVERLGIKTYNWWNEALHGVARAGIATVFPQPIGMAATFDTDLIYQTFDLVSDEARAKNTRSSAQGSYKRYQGLTMWTPTVNIYRDPRWGRGIETYGEDPYLAGVMGVAVVKGLQGPADAKYHKLHACAKHFAVHSGPEWNRHTFNAENIKLRDLYETYLPPFEALVKEANVKEVMCAYNRFEGDPCCGSNRLLHQILREDWGFEGIVVADCGAVADFYNERGHKTHANAEVASAVAVIAGTDLDCGSSYRVLVQSVTDGHIAEEDIDVSVIRLMQARFELGEMDQPEDVAWAKIPYEVVASQAHDQVALEVARRSMTLLMNKNGALPLKRGGLRVAVMGPNANDSVMQWGNYNGTPKQTITILKGIEDALGANDQLIYEKGCDLVERTLFKSAFADCRSADGVGFSAQYWNNLAFEGTLAATDQIVNPFNFCTSGATVFAPGVELVDFSSVYSTVFTPEVNGEVVFNFYVCGEVNLYIDGEKARGTRSNHGSRNMVHKLKVQKGRSYDIKIDFKYSMGDAQLNFDLGFKQDIDIKRSIAQVKGADLVIFVGGISPSLEGEEMGVSLPGFKGGDRTEIELPAVQREMISELRKAGKKVIFVNCSGSPIAMEPEVANCEAILQAWYPGQSGGKAVAEVLFGDYNPAGRLPVTFYRNIAQLPDFEDYNMEGRTYRYLKEEPLFPFGHGLSYSTFSYGEVALSSSVVKAGEVLTLSVLVTNLSERDGDEVVQIYLNKPSDLEGPAKTLRAFKRVAIPAGKTVSVTFELSEKQLVWWDTVANWQSFHAGSYELLVGGSSRDADLKRVALTFE